MNSGKSSPSNLNRSYSLRLSNTNVNCIRTSLVRRNQSMSAKQIRFFRNGDRYFSGLTLAVSPDRYKEFVSLLTELSSKLNLSTGAVRFVFNADIGTMITDVSDLQYGVPYVCSSSNTFRQIEGGYGRLVVHNTSGVGTPKMKNQYRQLQPIENNQLFNKCDNTSSKDFIKPKLVTVIRNGKPPQKKVTLLLNNKTAITLDKVLDQLSAKGSLGKVDKLHTTDGKPIRTLRDLFDDNTVFIALSTNEKFPEDGIELDPNSYRITPFREMKKPGGMAVRRSNSLRQGLRYKDENENVSMSRMSKNRRSNNVKINTSKVARPRGNTFKNNEQNNKEELYPASVFGTDSESDCDYDGYSMFGIKKEKHSVHSLYKIGAIIGDGNFAIVRECRNRKTQKSFALKIINKSKVKGKEHMIENEILILRRISHPCIVKLHEEFETPKEIYLVMELVEGGDLFDAIVTNTRFSEPESAFMVHDLASSVKYLHSLNIVHRDIKPENLLVVNRPDGRKSIKLADFGLSIEVKSSMFLVCGTPTYVAPEILDESGYGLEVDNWAIGVICYILLCGFPPFRSTNHDQEELFEKILRGEYEYLEPFWNDVSDGPRDLIDRLLVVDASERYRAEEILQHFWIKKWTEPTEKMHRELSEAEEANMKNRKRLRGIALAIQSVISLLYLVRSRNNNNNIKINSNTTEETTEPPPPPPPTTTTTTTTTLEVSEDLEDGPKDSISPNITRIPRPKPAPNSPATEVRNSITTPMKRRIGASTRSPSYRPTSQYAPDYSFKKGFFKREEVIQNDSVLAKRSARKQKPAPTTTMRQIKDAKTAALRMSAHSTTSKDKNTTRKFRPLSVIEIRHEHQEKTQFRNRPNSVQDFSLDRSGVEPSKTVKALNFKPSSSSTQQQQQQQQKRPVTTSNSTPTSTTLTSNSADNVVGESYGTASNGVRLRKKTPRSRAVSMVELSTTNNNKTASSANRNSKIESEILPKKHVDSSTTVSVETQQQQQQQQQQPQQNFTKNVLRSSLRGTTKQRPTSLFVSSDRNCPASRKALTPTTDEFNRKRLQYKLNDQLNDIKKEENSDGRLSPKKNTKFKLSNLRSPRCRSPTRRKDKDVKEPAKRSVSAPRGRSPARQPLKKDLLSNTSSSSKSSASPAPRKSSVLGRVRTDSEASQNMSPLARKLSTSSITSNRGGSAGSSQRNKWNSGTAVNYKQQTDARRVQSATTNKKSSPKTSIITSLRNQFPKQQTTNTNSESSSKTTQNSPGKVRITTEVNKRKNIKFPDGKTVDKETKTTTTVSVDVSNGVSNSSSDSRRNKIGNSERTSLLEKVKTLAEEIGTLSKIDRTPSSDSSSDSIVTHALTTTSTTLQRPITVSRSGSDIVSDVIKEEMDRFSETEYLSLVENQK